MTITLDLNHSYEVIDQVNPYQIIYYVADFVIEKIPTNPKYLFDAVNRAFIFRPQTEDLSVPAIDKQTIFKASINRFIFQPIAKSLIFRDKKNDGRL